MKIQAKDPAAELTLNLAPMIDVVFLLLIFFMVATTFAKQEKELSLDLPAAEGGEVAAKALDEIVVNILADGTVRISRQDYGTDALRELLVQAGRRNPETPVTIRGDRTSQLQFVTEIMGMCRVAGLVDIGIMTIDK